MNARDEATRSRPLGLPSALLGTVAVTAAVYGLVRAAEKGWGDTWTLVPLGAAVVLAAALLVSDRRAREPLLPPSSTRSAS